MALLPPFLWTALLCGLPAQEPVLRRSDIVFMYQADRQTYADYGATVLAWGGTPTPESLAAAEGVRFFGSVGMVTEFGRYYERFPDDYEQGLCRDVDGNPVKVPWLTDHQHKGIPYWWCCTQQPLFRQYLRERVIETMQAGAAGLHIDDHLGTSGGLWLGICFCDRCLAGFRAYLQSLPAAELQHLGIDAPEGYDYRAAVQAWQAAGTGEERQVTRHLLWPQWTVYQRRAAAAFMAELKELAAQTAGHAVPMGANAGLLWPGHLSDYQTLDLFSAETDHHAGEGRPTMAPLLAYRLADAVQRPYAATASGWDWAFIKEQDLPGLVRGWIALSYAAGHFLMAPHRQWCYTEEKGTHWYDGPKERFAPLYRFVRRHAGLFDGYHSCADLGVVLPYGSFSRDPGRWIDLCRQLADANLSYRIVLAGDAVVDHPLPAAELEASPVLLAPDRDALLPVDGQTLADHCGQVLGTVEEALAAVRPAVRIEGTQAVRALPRIRPGSAVIHLLNQAYDPERDDVTTLGPLQVRLDLGALGMPQATRCTLVAPDADLKTLAISDSRVEIPSLGLWALLVLGEIG